MDYSNSSNSTMEEFPYWQPVLTFNFFLDFVLPLTLFWNVSVFVALIKSKLGNKPLTILYSSLMLILCVDKIAETILTAIIAPDLIRYCICNTIAFAFLTAESGFSTLFSVITISCQSMLQLQIIRGKKQWNNYNRIISCIGVIILIALIWSVLILLQQIFLPPSLNTCQPLCLQNFTVLFQAENIFLAVYLGVFLLPAAVTITVTSIWCVVLFKKMSIQQKNTDYSDLSKKLLLMPIIMVFLIFGNLSIGYLLSAVFSEVLKLAGLEDYIGNWAILGSDVSYAIGSLLQGVSYPITLLIFSTKLRKSWKGLFRRKHNKVQSEIRSTSNNTEECNQINTE